MNHLAIALVSLSLLTTQAWAQDFPFQTPRGGQRFSVQAEHSTTETGTDVVEDRLNLSLPLYTSERGHTWNFIARGQQVVLSEAPVLQNRGFELPEHFGSAEVGISASFAPAGNTTRGFSLTAGTNGRQLLNPDNSMIVNANYFAETKRENGDTWYFFLNYSNNRPFLNNIPLPGFGYSLNGETYRVFLGAPVIFMMWMPRPWIFNLTMSPFFSSAETAVFVWGPLQATTSISWLPRAYQNIVPDVDDEQLLYDKKEWSTGLRLAFGPQISYSLQYVYAFDRRFFAGRSVGDRRSDAAELADSGGVQLRARASF